MKRFKIDRKLLVVFGLLLVLAISLIAISDFCIRTMIENSKVISLNKHAETDITAQQVKHQQLKSEVSTLTEAVNLKVGLRYPTLQDLKIRASDSRLSLRQLEKGSQSSKDSPKGIKYLASFVGGISSQVSFLKEIESEFLFESDGLVLKPADEKGEKVIMTISVLISE